MLPLTWRSSPLPGGLRLPRSKQPGCWVGTSPCVVGVPACALIYIVVRPTVCRYYVLRHSLHPLKDVGLLCFKGEREGGRSVQGRGQARAAGRRTPVDLM